MHNSQESQAVHWDSSPKCRKSATDILRVSGTRDPLYPLERVRKFRSALEPRASSVEHLFVPTRRVFPRRCIPAVRRCLLARI